MQDSRVKISRAEIASRKERSRRRQDDQGVALCHHPDFRR